ncbi:hypothetical protein [Methylocapsa sp. S129]|uniref:hypothetical protein n=1 Tax=Methylocapsa sp. S129 TaxID=1641869 RepID=UPI00131E675C|nr:hypothetical protein [Methylocapsa sp. S129]
MDLPDVSKPPWGFVEWAFTGLATLTVSVVAFIWRLMTRLERMSLSIDRQRADFEADKEANSASFIRLTETLAQMNHDHYRLRETLGGLPSRGDLRDVEDHIGERIEALAARFDRALEKRGM